MKILFILISLIINVACTANSNLSLSSGDDLDKRGIVELTGKNP